MLNHYPLEFKMKYKRYFLSALILSTNSVMANNQYFIPMTSGCSSGVSAPVTYSFTTPPSPAPSVVGIIIRVYPPGGTCGNVTTTATTVSSGAFPLKANGGTLQICASTSYSGLALLVCPNTGSASVGFRLGAQVTTNPAHSCPVTSPGTGCYVATCSDGVITNIATVSQQTFVCA
jgi:hypothetical protein